MTARCGARLPIGYADLICGLPAGHDGSHECTRGDGSVTSWSPHIPSGDDSRADERARCIAEIRDAWREQCCGNRNEDACESCRAYADAIRAIGGRP